MPTLDQTRRLAFIRYLYGIAVGQSHQPEPAMGSAVLTFHDAVELFLSLAAEHLNVGRSSLGFMDYFEVLKAPLGQDLAQKESMRRLNTARVGLKHSGTFPSKMSVEGFRASVTEFFETNVPTVFSVDFGSVSLIDLISDSEAYPHLQQAQDALQKAQLKDAMSGATKAFAVLIEEYEKTMTTQFGRELTSTKSSFMHSEFADLVELQEAIKTMQQAMKILSLGLDYQRYSRFKMITPIVHSPINGPHIITWMPMTPDPREVDCQFAIDFVIEAALRLRDSAYEV